MVQLHSRYFPQDFFILLVVLRVLNYDWSIVIGYSVYAQMLAWLLSLKVAGRGAFKFLLHRTILIIYFSLAYKIPYLMLFKSYRSGADFLGPLLPAVAEICSDFDPTMNIEPSLLKLFRNLWFYIALFGLAPPIQKSQLQTKSVSSMLNSVGSTAIALQAVSGPYLWNTQWSSAVQFIAQGTPPLVSILRFLLLFWD